MSAPPVVALDRWDRWLNPVLVRVVRQELRSRAFIGIYVLVLAAAAVCAIVASSVATDRSFGDAGRALFAVTGIGWSLVVALVQPLTAFQAVVRERNEDTWELVEITGLPPRRIVIGLLQAAVVQGLVYAGALAPFLTMSYLLQGVDLGMVLLALAVMPLVGVLTAAVGVFVACLGRNRASRQGLSGLVGLGGAGLWSLSFPFWIIGVREILAELQRLPAAGLAAVVGVTCNLWLVGVAFFVVLAGTMLTHRAQDRATAARTLFYAIWLNTGLWFLGFGLWMWFVEGSHDWSGVLGFLTFFGVFGVTWAFVLGFFSVTEEFELSRRQARAISEAPRWRRWAAFITGPGAARGRCAFLCLLLPNVACLLVAMTLAKTPFIALHSSFLDREFAPLVWGTLALASHFLAQLVIGDALGRRFFRTPLARRMMILGLVVMTAAVVPLGLLLADPDQHHRLLWAISPFFATGMVAMEAREWSDGWVTIIVLMLGVSACAVLAVQAWRLRIATIAVTARADDPNPRGG